jgi:hypothetical protein
MNLSQGKRLVFGLVPGGLLLVGLFLLLNGAAHMARADSGDLFVTTGGSGDCSQANPCDLQMALETASDGAALYVAEGTYTGRGGAVLTVTHSLTLHGGWDGTTASPPVCDPGAHPTTMDAEGTRRGVYISDSLTVTLEGFTVTNGVASSAGAGLIANATRLTLRGMTFYSNVISTTARAAFGGGAMVEGGTLQVVDSTFQANSVRGGQTSEGGGLVISNTLAATVTGNLFQDNDAWHASGLLCWAPSGGGERVSLTLRGNRFVGNGRGNSPGTVNGGYAGAIKITHANARVEDNLVEQNASAAGRGAIQVSYSDLYMARNIISGNRSYYHASSLYLDYLSSPFTLVNNVIVENQATYSWVKHQSVLIRGSAGQMLHNTIARSDNTYGIRLEEGASVALTNTLLVSHTVGITVTAGSTATLEGTLWGSGSWANGTDWDGDGAIDTGTVNIWGDPGFVNPGGGDYHLGPSSEARNAGVEAGVTDDVDGEPRLGIPDIGADEYWWYVYLPLVIRNN